MRPVIIVSSRTDCHELTRQNEATDDKLGPRLGQPALPAVPARPGIHVLACAVDASAMDNESQPQTIRIVLDEAVAQGEYVNFANIIHSQSEFVIDLGRVVPGRTDVKIYSRVILTPLHAKQLLEALGHNLGLFEQKYGEIRGDATAPYSQNEPSN